MLKFGIFIYSLTAASGAVASPVFHTSNPTAIVNSNEVITGKLENNVETFKGIPFAEPPLGNLRFHRPVDYKGSYHGLLADKFNPSCMQINPKGAVGCPGYGPIRLSTRRQQRPSF